MTDKDEIVFNTLVKKLGPKAVEEAFLRLEKDRTKDFTGLVVAVEELLASMDAMSMEIPQNYRLDAARQECYRNLNIVRDKYLGWT